MGSTREISTALIDELPIGSPLATEIEIVRNVSIKLELVSGILVEVWNITERLLDTDADTALMIRRSFDECLSEQMTNWQGILDSYGVDIFLLWKLGVDELNDPQKIIANAQAMCCCIIMGVRNYLATKVVGDVSQMTFRDINPEYDNMLQVLGWWTCGNERSFPARVRLWGPAPDDVVELRSDINPFFVNLSKMCTKLCLFTVQVYIFGNKRIIQESLRPNSRLFRHDDGRIAQIIASGAPSSELLQHLLYRLVFYLTPLSYYLVQDMSITPGMIVMMHKSIQQMAYAYVAHRTRTTPDRVSDDRLRAFLPNIYIVLSDWNFDPHIVIGRLAANMIFGRASNIVSVFAGINVGGVQDMDTSQTTDELTQLFGYMSQFHAPQNSAQQELKDKMEVMLHEFKSDKPHPYDSEVLSNIVLSADNMGNLVDLIISTSRTDVISIMMRYDKFISHNVG